eukprot:GHVU01074714.1.p1 GENE.GHVU01074714.1~~GHVU01074714.1.p1  ORF type:complete len:113 (-),score=1.89 GHVU01074714.1:796-1134(-)
MHVFECVLLSVLVGHGSSCRPPRPLVCASLGSAESAGASAGCPGEVHCIGHSLTQLTSETGTRQGHKRRPIVVSMSNPPPRTLALRLLLPRQSLSPLLYGRSMRSSNGEVEG